MRCTQCAAATPMISCGGLCWVRLWLSSGSYRDIHLCVCLLCGSRLFLWIFHAVLRTSLVEGWLHGGRCITVSCFMFAQAAQRFVPRMQKLGIVAGVLCNVAFTIMRQQQAQSA